MITEMQYKMMKGTLLIARTNYERGDLAAAELGARKAIRILERDLSLYNSVLGHLAARNTQQPYKIVEPAEEQQEEIKLD